VDTQLPTPPNETVAPTSVSPQKQQTNGWRTPPSHNRSTPSSSPPPLDELPNFEESQHDQLLPGTGLNSLLMVDEQTFSFPSSFKASPTSSNEVEVDDDTADLGGFEANPIQPLDGVWEKLYSSSSPSPIDSDFNPFSDANSQKNEVVDNDEIPRP
jgi:ubiquitin carboxyl-terminal hydrolase 4/11/15